jgi:hypothetical protein
MCGALAIAAVLLVPGARADEYNKLTYLTFSGPVQVPGVTLPAGTYMFKLANPESGRRAIQIWDEKGEKLFTTLLTIPDVALEAKDEPVVMFSERPSGSAQAVRSWFYPAERTGFEFIYPKSQAMKIAESANAPVLAYTDDVKSDADEVAMRGANVGRVDAQGQAAADAAAASTTTTTTAANTAPAAPAPAPSVTASAATADAPAATANAASPSANPSANRTEPPAAAAAPATTAAAQSTTTAPSTTAAADRAPSTTTARAQQPAAPPANDAPVGTSGAQSARPETARELPRTASPLTAIGLLSVLMIASAAGVRQLRRRFAENV